MRRLVVIGLAALTLTVVAVVARRGGDDVAKPVTASKTPVAVATTTASPRTVETIAPGVQFDDDPPGVLRLEGQVIDLADKPVARATVMIDANPPREAHTEDDGSFAFDGLTPRTYRVSARAGDDVSPAASIRLAPQTEPVVLRVRPMARIEVAVTGDGGKPLRGALVELRDLVPVTAVTDDAGKAVLKGVGAGWHVVKASADGHASAFREVPTTGDPAAVAMVAIALRAGASISGTVVDSGGAPVESARVVPEHVGHFDDFYDARFDAVLTDAKGRWRITGLPRETTRIRAYHADYAPAVSSPLVLADEAVRGGVTIVLERGVRIAGRVVDVANAPVAGAEVRISADTILTGQVRRVATDANGAFTMGGLPRRLMYIMAASDGATSETTAIDLVKPASSLLLRLDRGASLTGIVVTTTGVPVPEARVTAMRARTDSATDQLETRLRGTESAIAGTDGRFEIKGLPPGSYLARAIRPGSPSELAYARMGVPVETGTEAKLVVDDLSTLTGKLAFADGKPATRFAIRIGTTQPRYIASDTGAFELKDIPAGKTFLNITGTDFVSLSLSDVEVGAKPTELGTLTVTAGRTLEGTVVDRDNRPVAGASIVLAREIRGDGTSLTPYPDYRVLETVSNADGTFTLRGIGTSMQQIAADHETAGRSAMTTVRPGTASLAITLALAPPGVIQGFVRVDGKPAEALLVARPTAAADSRVTVRTGGDGSYRFDRVAPDRYSLIAIVLSGHRDELNAGKAYQIDVAPGATITKDIDLSTTGVTIQLHLGTPATVEFAYGVIAVLDDAASVTSPLPKTISEGRTFGGKLGSYAMREGMLVSNRAVKFEKVPAGSHIACIAPLRADPADPAVIAEMQRGAADWPLYCRWITVAAAPDLQHVTVDVQPPPSPKP